MGNTKTATTSYDIYYLSGNTSVQYGSTTSPYFDPSTISVYCTQYGGYLTDFEIITPESVSDGIYSTQMVASSPDGVYNVYFTIYGQTNGETGYIEVTDTEYIP